MNPGIIKKYLVFSCMALSLSCSQVNFTNSNGDDADKNNNASDSGRRPTEGGEGVPGYLVDPNLVSVNLENDLLAGAVTGLPGAVVSLSEGSKKAIQANVQVFAVDKSDVAEVAAGNKNSVSGVLLGSARTSPDGSFAVALDLSMANPETQQLVTSVSSRERPDGIDFLTGNQATASAISADIAEGEQAFSPMFPNSSSIGGSKALTQEDPPEGESFSWILAPNMQSCATACGDELSVNDATRLEVGSGGSLAACSAKVASFGVVIIQSLDMSVLPDYGGCQYSNLTKTVYWFGKSETSATALPNSFTSRVCACNAN